MHNKHFITTEAVGIAGDVSIIGERIAVVAVQAAMGGDPQESLAVLKNELDPGLAEPLIGAEMLEAQVELRFGGGQR